jgi:argininosuccinate lyase
MPFRRAHEIVGRAVLRATEMMVRMPFAEYKNSLQINEDV